ncbi:metalloregulator ArsR/SmtB family transcription factor [Blastopirellula sp. JC732]|uniref:Metalloregulator ArsR/SmtB family transcription factor n=1 Tax=Blastopirellula sediminis TaxID=2894196 RepID=A0A9X1SLF7_9BACT|nr:metalloregulator ArsR/SmtB family transcription factor [Blastopirellula sediminis]MCC9606042.1 metalloregulator ArsR/SmtB family transcription factor [Blastopirellula sediminis]MCC9630659.1 metalloregulator ArsR/SmtB family transcription factor [Blastopirellula sediminis]
MATLPSQNLAEETGSLAHDEEARVSAAALFHALGDPARLHLAALLIHRELCVSQLAELLDDSLPAISQRLKLLKQERIVKARRDGKHVYYQLDDDHIAALVINALAHAEESR